MPQTCPYELATLYGTLLNDPAELTHYGAALHEKPYTAPPNAPVLYIKTANTVNTSAQVPLPESCPALEVGASLGMVIRRATLLPAQCSGAAQAQDVAGVLLLADWCVPHANVYRPPIQYRNRDGFLGVGELIACPAGCDLDAWVASIRLDIHINGKPVQTVQFSAMQRSATRLLADMGGMFSLRGDAQAASDVLMLGLAWNAGHARPQASLGDVVSITAIDAHSGQTLAQLTQTVVAQPQWTASAHTPTVVCKAASIFCLGLNYADHAKELAFKPPETPLVFLKSAAALAPDQTRVPRPSGVTHMHYECELAVIIGQTAKNVPRENAYDYVAGYTIANDYAIRDYLENYYRPNLRVKNRDRCTPFLEPITPAARVPQPMDLSLSTRVNGVLTQSGSTRDMVFGIPELIEYLSHIMTLRPGDMILTGTPDGVVDCKVGDEVICEIAGLGVLVNTMVAS